MPLPHDLQVQRDNNGRTFGGTCAVKETLHKVIVFERVDLKPERVGGVFGHILDRANRHGGQRERDAELSGRAGGFDLAVSALHARKTDRGEGHRHRHILTDHLACSVAVGHIHRDPLLEPDLIEIGCVFTERLFGPTAAFGIVVEHLRCTALMQPLQVRDCCDDRHAKILELVKSYYQYNGFAAI